MGMFDSVMLKVKCPYCGNEDEKECQTKEFDCVLAVWKVGDYVSDRTRKAFNCITECLSPSCIGRPGLKGSFFYLIVYLKKGKVTGRYKIIKSLYGK